MKQFLLICFAFLAFSASAQSPYKPFFNNSAWYVRVQDQIGGPQYYWHHATDSIINNQVFKIMPNGIGFHLMREDIIERKVYIKFNNTGQEKILYDFGMTTIGGQVTMPLNGGYSYTFTLMVLDSVLTNDGYRRRFKYSLPNGAVLPDVIEGIGSVYEPIRLYNTAGDPTYWLQCAYQNNIQVYSDPYSNTCPPNPYAVNAISEQAEQEYLSVYPNPANDMFKLEIPESAEGLVVTLTDMTGRIVHSEKVHTGNAAAINTAGISNGTYVVSVQTAGALYRAKAIISR